MKFWSFGNYICWSGLLFIGEWFVSKSSIGQPWPPNSSADFCPGTISSGEYVDLPLKVGCCGGKRPDHLLQHGWYRREREIFSSNRQLVPHRLFPSIPRYSTTLAYRNRIEFSHGLRYSISTLPVPSSHARWCRIVASPMMSSRAELRRRIPSVNSAEKVIAAMRLVAAARIRSSQVGALRTRPFAEKLQAMLASLLEAIARDGHDA